MNRDRFVLSAGHASTLLYTILHLAKVKAVDPEYEILGRHRSHWRTSSRFDNSGVAAQGTRSIAGPQASRQPQVP
jgi:transketolase N-terminal domain/subunit